MWKRRVDAALTAGEAESAARVRRHVEVLAELIGPRHVGKVEMLRAAERYVRETLAETGLAVTEQAYRAGGQDVKNIIAEQPGRRRADEIVVVGAHYDSVPETPGADDNASGMAGVLEVARLLSGRKLRRTVRYVGFVNEEPPFYKGDDMGSVRYARACAARGEKIVAMVNLEMIGWYSQERGSQRWPEHKWVKRLQWALPTRGNFVMVCADRRSAGLLPGMVWRMRCAARLRVMPVVAPRSVMGPDMSDHWSFWEAGYRAVMVTDTAFLRNDRYHTADDTLARMNVPAMARVVRGVAAAVAGLAG